MQITFSIIKSTIATFLKSVSNPPFKEVKKINIKSIGEANQKKEEVENILREFAISKVKVEFVYCEKQGAEFTLKGNIPLGQIKNFEKAMDKINTLGLRWFFCQQFTEGSLKLDSIYPYGFGKSN